MYSWYFKKVMASLAPEIETSRLEIAERVFARCTEHKNDIIYDLDKEFTNIEDKLPEMVSDKIRKLFFSKTKDRPSFNIVGTLKTKDGIAQLDNTYYPFIFDKNIVNLKLEENGTLPLDTKFCEFLEMLTGKITNNDKSIVCETYALALHRILSKYADNILEKVIDKYTEGVLDYPYSQYEDIKEYVNFMVYNSMGYISLIHYLKNVSEFVWFVGWTDKTIGNVIEKI